MKYKINGPWIGIVLILLAGCAAMQRKRSDSMIGCDESRLVSDWGQPSAVQSLSDGGKMLIYSNAPTRKYHNDPNTSLGGGYYWPGETRVTTIPHSTQFVVSSNHLVTSWEKK